MTEPAIHRMTVRGILRRIQDSDLTATTVVDAVPERIHKRNDRTNAFVTVTDDRAREAARDVDDAVENRKPLGPLAGVPVAIKDLDDVTGVYTTRGSMLLADRVADTPDCPSRDT